ncbi:hypothetical protein Gotur_003543 [Gossypium turneri]
MLLQSFLRRQPPSSPLESSPISSLSASPTMVGFISYESSKCCGFEQALTLASDLEMLCFLLLEILEAGARGRFGEEDANGDGFN